MAARELPAFAALKVYEEQLDASIANLHLCGDPLLSQLSGRRNTPHPISSDRPQLVASDVCSANSGDCVVALRADVWGGCCRSSQQLAQPSYAHAMPESSCGRQFSSPPDVVASALGQNTSNGPHGYFEAGQGRSCEATAKDMVPVGDEPSFANDGAACTVGALATHVHTAARCTCSDSVCSNNGCEQQCKPGPPVDSDKGYGFNSPGDVPFRNGEPVAGAPAASTTALNGNSNSDTVGSSHRTRVNHSLSKGRGESVAGDVDGALCEVSDSGPHSAGACLQVAEGAPCLPRSGERLSLTVRRVLKVHRNLLRL